MNKALDQSQYKNGKIGEHSGLFLREGSAPSKNCSFLKSSKDIWSFVNPKMKKKDVEFDISLAIGQRNEDLGDEVLTKAKLAAMSPRKQISYSQDEFGGDGDPDAKTEPQIKEEGKSGKESADASRSADKMSEAFVLALYRCEKDNNPYRHGMNKRLHR